MNGWRIEGKGGIHCCFLEKILFSLSGSEEEIHRWMDDWLAESLAGSLDGWMVDGWIDL